MASPDHKVRVFISSTFRDMHAERDHLVTVVFPELRERCERLGLDFFDVDLRWGVPEKGVDGESANSWEYCRKWINEAKPFFVCLLGQRYGWEPEPEQLKDPEDRARQLEQKRSITDMEVHHALENDAHSRRCYFYLRQAQAPAAATEFVDPPPLLVKLDALKARVETCGRPVWHYPCRWTGSGFTDMEAFGKKILENLWSGILRDPRYVSKDVWQQVLGCKPEEDERYTDETKPVPEDIADKLIPLAKPPPKTPLEAEREQMAAFADSRLKWFQGRTKEIEELKKFITDPAETHDSPRLALLAAQPGQGKSALMAMLWDEMQGRALGPPSADSDARRVEDNEPYVIAHFVGATEKSSTAYHLVRRLNDELDASGIAFPERPVPEGQTKEEPKLDFQSICQRLWDRLGDYAGDKRIVILLDALNQLDDGHELGWLPYRLGPSVRVVVSCIHDPTSKEESAERKVLTALTSRHPQPLRIPLGELTRDDVRTIVVEYLREYCHELDREHLDTLCAIPQARNPLYLTVMLNALRTLGGNDLNTLVPARIAAMPQDYPDTVSLFAWVLQRMETAEGFGKEAVQAWCLYLALGRVGMASRELADLLARKLGPDAALTAQRIERALRRYLQRRGETLDFFHGQLRQAVMERCGKDAKNISQAHREIADYFRSLADPLGDRTWKGENLRAFSETAPHLICAEQWDGLCAYLTDFRCLDCRVQAGQIFDIVRDHKAALAALPEFAEEARQGRERIRICAEYGMALIAYARECGQGMHSPLPRPPNTKRLDTPACHPEVNSPRAALLQAISNFTALRATLIAPHSNLFLSFAANAAADGPLNDAGVILDTNNRPWLQRSPRPPTSPLSPQCLQTLQGHTGCVTSVCLTPDGGRAVSGSWDKTLRVWDLDSNRCLQIFHGHTSYVWSVSLTPDARRAISGSRDKTLRVWDLIGGQCLQILQGHTEDVWCVCITPDGRRAVSASGDKTLRVWDLNNGRCLQILQGHTAEVMSVCLTPDGSHAVSGGDDNTLRVWDLNLGQCIKILRGHSGWVSSVCLTPDGRRAVSGGWDKTLRVWDLVSGRCLQTLQAHSERILHVSLASDGRLAVSGSKDHTLKIWCLDGGQYLGTFQGHISYVTSVCPVPDFRCIVSSSSDHTLRVWNPESDESLRTLEGHASYVSCVFLNANVRCAVSGSNDHTLRIWDIDSGQCLRTLHGHNGSITSVVLTPDGQRAVSGSGQAVGSRDQTLRLWDLGSGRCLQILHGHTEDICCVCIAPDGHSAVSGSDDHTLRVWDLVSGRCLHILQGHMDDVLRVTVTPDSRRAISGSRDNTLRVWDIESGQCLQILQGHTDFVGRLVLTPNGLRAVSGSWDNTLRIWDLLSGQCLQILRGHTGGIVSVGLTPDGCCAVSGSDDNTLRVWDMESGRCLRILQGHTDGVHSLGLFPNARHVVSGSGDNTLRVWDLETGQCLAVYHAGASVFCVAVSPIGDRIVCGTSDGQMHFLTLRNFPPLA